MAGEKRIDYTLTTIITVLLFLGFLVLFSVSASAGKESFEDSFYYVKHQLFFGFLPGIIIGLFFYLVGEKKLKKMSLLLFLGNLAFSAAVFLPSFGREIGGARRWLSFGGYSLQPAEFLKITLPLYLATWLEKQKRKDLITIVCLILVLTPVSIILIKQRDLSSLTLLLFLAFCIYFLSEAPFPHLVGLAGLSGIVVLLLINFTPYRLARFLVFLNPDTDPMGTGYQIKQSQIAIGSGGIWGKGFGLSEQKFGYLPNVVSDTIFPAFCEEAGFIGAFILVFLFLLLLTRVILRASSIKDQFSKALSITLTAGIILQAFLNMAAMSGLVPLTGIPLPFFSYGGTHLAVEIASCGIILNLLKNS